MHDMKRISMYQDNLHIINC